MEGIEKIKTEKIGKNSEGRREDSGWSGSIVFWPSPPPPLHRTNMAGQKASLQANNGRVLQDIARKAYTWKSPRKKNWDMQASTVHCADESIQGYSGGVRWIIWRPKSPEMTEVRTIEYGIVCDILAKFSLFETPTKRTGLLTLYMWLGDVVGHQNVKVKETTDSFRSKLPFLSNVFKLLFWYSDGS